MRDVTLQKRLHNLRLPLEGHIDLTYRCNNHCRHCWLRIPQDAPARNRELSFDEIRGIVDQARALGTHRWSISGGEPMLRLDFSDIFEYLTGKAVSYTFNTNGTLITPEIARILTHKGTKMVALYGATKETYDNVTRHPGGFEKVMQGFRYLQEAGAGFIVQLIPMRDNWHEWEQMTELAQSLSRHWRVGAPWLYLSSCHDPERNAEIARQLHRRPAGLPCRPLRRHDILFFPQGPRYALRPAQGDGPGGLGDVHSLAGG